MANDLLSRPDQDSDSLERLFAAPSAKTSGSDIAARNKEIQQLESQFNSSPSASGQALSNKHPLRRSRGASRPTPVRRSRLLSQPPAGTSEPEQPQVTPQTTPDQDSGRDVYDQPGFDSELHSDPLSAPDSDTRNSDEKQENGSQALDSGDLKKREDNPESEYGPSAKDDLQRRHDEARERLGLGYTGDPDELDQDTKRRNKWYNSNSKLKKRMSIAAAVGGGSALTAVLLFFLMMPLKLVSMSKMLETQYMSQAYSAIEKAGGHMLGEYFRNSVITALNTGTCKNTVSPKCVIVPRGTGPIGKTYAAWQKNKIELELATKHGLIFGMKKGGPTGKQFYMSVDGKDFDLRSFIKDPDMSLFDIPGMELSDRAKIRASIKEALRTEPALKRFVVNRYLKKHFGIRHCIQRCDWIDGSSAKVDTAIAKMADKSLLYKIKSVQLLVPSKFSIAILCLSDPNTCKTSLDPASRGDDSRMSPAQKELQKIILAAAENFGQERIEDLVKLATSAEGSGSVGKAITETVVKKAFGEGAGKFAAKASNPIGWILAISSFISAASVLPDILAHVSYVANTTTALETAAMFNTIVSEQMSGNADTEAVGSFATGLTKDAPDSGEFASDATDTPLYQAIAGVPAGANTSTALLTPLIFPIAHAAEDARTNATSAYLCSDKNPVPKGELECADGKPEQRSETLDLVEKVLCSGALGLLCPVTQFITGVGDWFIGIAFEVTCTFNRVCKPLLDSFTRVIEQTGLMGQLTALLVRMFSMATIRNDGGRMFNTWALGEDVKGNLTVRDSLGGLPVSPEEVAIERNEYFEIERASFESRPLVARLFSTDTQYSLVSQMSLQTPATTDGAFRSTIATLLNNPSTGVLSSLSGTLASTFNSRAYAAASNQAAIASAFDTPQYVFPESSIPTQPLEYWGANCSQNYDEDTGQLDKSDWLNNDTKGHPVVGQTNTKENPCILLQTTSIALGAAFDPTLVPQDSADLTPASTSLDTSQLYADSSGVACTPGTNDLGIQDGYNDGNLVKIRICAIPGFRSSASESSADPTYGIPGADGNVIVNSRVSSAWLALFTAAKGDGVTLSSESSFRTNAKQRSLWFQLGQNRRLVAPPGYSNHQMGLAIDFDGPSAKNPDAQDCTSRVTQPGNPTWDWLEAHAAAYGFKQYSAESWHWDPDPMSNRCGGGG